VTGEPAAPSSAIGAFAVSEDGWAFEGALTLEDAAAVLDASRTMPLPASGVVDLRGLLQADSSALAVIMALRRRAAAEGRTLSITGLPAPLRSLAVVYGVENLIE
jgi:phospholipid transport system transporter-binding protein